MEPTLYPITPDPWFEIEAYLLGTPPMYWQCMFSLGMKLSSFIPEPRNARNKNFLLLFLFILAQSLLFCSCGVCCFVRVWEGCKINPRYLFGLVPPPRDSPTIHLPPASHARFFRCSVPPRMSSHRTEGADAVRWNASPYPHWQPCNQAPFRHL